MVGTCDPVPSEVRVSKLWSLSSTCKNLKLPRCFLSKKLIWVGQNALCLAEQSLRTFFTERGRDRSRSNSFRIVDILIRLGDIRGRTVKSSEIVLNFGRFWPQYFF